MRCIFTSRTIGITSFSIVTNRTIGTNGPSELTNRIRLCILDMSGGSSFFFYRYTFFQLKTYNNTLLTLRTSLTLVTILTMLTLLTMLPLLQLILHLQYTI